MSRQKKKESGEHPVVIKGVPSVKVISDRNTSRLSNDGEQRIATLTEIQSLKLQTTDPEDIQYLKSEEREVKLHLFYERFSSTSTLDICATKSGLKGLFILDENEQDGSGIYVEDGYLCASVSALELLHGLMNSLESRQWIEGMEYLVNFLRFVSENEGCTRYSESNALANAHAKVWAKSEDKEESLEAAARALLILKHIDNNEDYSISRERVEQQFSLLGDEIAQEVYKRIEKCCAAESLFFP